MVVDWEQETGLLMSSGDVRIVRIWDTDREMKVQVPPALSRDLRDRAGVRPRRPDRASGPGHEAAPCPA